MMSSFNNHNDNDNDNHNDNDNDNIYNHNNTTTTIIHLCVAGMMCQKSCGSTVEAALTTAFDQTDTTSRVRVVSAHASFQDSYAQVTIAQHQHQQNQPLQRLEQQAVDAVECVGFDATVIPAAQVDAYLHQQQQQQQQRQRQRQPPLWNDKDDDGSSCASETARLVSSSSPSSSSSVGLLHPTDPHPHPHSPLFTTTTTTTTSRRTHSFQIGGMSCAICAGRVERALLAVQGVTHATVSLPTHRAYIQLDGGNSSSSSGNGESGGGNGESGGGNGESGGGNGGGTSTRIDSATGTTSTRDDHPDGRTSIDTTTTTLLLQDCVDAVTQAGYDCELVPSSFCNNNDNNNGSFLAQSAQRLEQARLDELHTWSRLLVLSLVFTLPLWLLQQQQQQQQHRHDDDDDDDATSSLWWWVQCALSTTVQGLVGRRFYRAAYLGWTQGRFLGMDFLIVLGTTASYLYSVGVWMWLLWTEDSTTSTGGSSSLMVQPTFATNAMLLTFVTLGKFLEVYAKGKTASALQTLMELQPNVAWKVIVNHSNEDEDDTGNGAATSTLAGVDMSSLETQEVSASDLVCGDHVLVLAGARIPADGILVAVSGATFRNTGTNVTNDSTHPASTAYVDESALSGEPFPVAKQPGETVFGSTVNQLTPLLIRVTATGGHTVLAKIVRLMEEAQSQKAPIQAQADQIACIFAPTVMVLSAITFVAWLVLNTSVESMEERFFWAFTSAISVIVVACPCALGLATPTAVMCGTGVGASHGLLIKGGAVLEGAHGIDTLIFDKTGTLTTARAILGDTRDFPLDKVCLDLPSRIAKEHVALWLAACAEKQSEHPLAKAIVNAARSLWGADITCSEDGVEVSDFHVIPGRGVECLVRQAMWGEYRVRVGARAFAKEPVVKGDGIVPSEDANDESDVEILAMRQAGQVGIYVSVISESECLQRVDPQGRPYARHVVGVLGIVDPVEMEAKSTVAALRKLGVEVWMCTGDNEVTAHAVARQVGIYEDNVCSGVSPEGKADLVTRLQKRDRTAVRRGKRDRRGRHANGRVAVVGDGINDAVALARADVGIAIGAGTEVAVEAADMVLVKSSLHDVVVALHLSRVVFRRIRLNFVWALAYNLFALPFAAGALYPFTNFRLPPEFAGLMMAFSSVSVVTSSLLLRTYSKPSIREDGTLDNDGCFSSVIPRRCCTLRSRIGRQPVPSYSIDDNDDSLVADGVEMV